MSEEQKDAGHITAEIATGHSTGGSSIPMDDQTTEDAVRAALLNLWEINDELHPLAAGTTSRVWRINDAIVKLARDESEHFNAGLRASLAVEESGITAGSPIVTGSGEVSARIYVGSDEWIMAVQRHVSGTPASMHDFEPHVLGEILAKIHVSLQHTDTSGGWAAEDVLGGYMEQGILPEQPESTRQMIASAIQAVREWYGESNSRKQLIRGDGPELLVEDNVVTGMIDWGGVRFGSVADDIGCWTLHGNTKDIKEYTREFVRGYSSVSTLTQQEELAIPLFQQLRLASRACFVTDLAALQTIGQWMSNIQ
ncbi:phosphotransferase enzyme family protein [Paenibacillus sp. OV219]|uniref:phosphotransferase enzyme family protein n=1 Tax=Paenibacillus sp. OV219 TaxID=1884377 RepID=UPI0008CA017F|nr:phosphotransferase [Paenibacillus sp. OV219]SEO19218.1 Ser/Thr protein kinase RdoA involved in Cpx stress response, MazF antagonist [Paenibacillus sp. OV219]